jgi:two-component system phosphate regulon response regulator OmpR|tara:strand:+ start:280 stop:960 length:681 start_codon:yes stop_codon:yes gene_type:complete
MVADMSHILVVDDDRRLRELLQKYLMDNGFRVTVAMDADNARQRLRAMEFDLIVMDRMMPGEDGLTFTRFIRKTSQVPILMLTAMGETEARIDGLEGGVDDYLSKPFEPRELVLRIEMILRRARTVPKAREIRLGNYVFDLERDILLGDGGALRLTTTEASLLRILAENAGRVLSRDALTQLCAIDGTDRMIDVQVTRLRRKIEPDTKAPRYLQTVRGQGYVLRPD